MKYKSSIDISIPVANIHCFFQKPPYDDQYRMEDKCRVLSVWSYLTYWAQWFLKAVFTCNHGQAHLGEGKFYCQSCGQGVIARWALLRCGECGAKRASRYLFRRLVPQEACCFHCGTWEAQLEYLEKPNYFQLKHAMLLLEEEGHYLAHQQPLSPVRAWLDSTGSLYDYLRGTPTQVNQTQTPAFCPVIIS